MPFIPRIRGKIGEGVDGKFYFFININILGAREHTEDIGPFGPYDTSEKADKVMREAAKICCEQYEKEFAGGVSGEVINMKTNKIQGWKSFLNENLSSKEE